MSQFETVDYPKKYDCNYKRSYAGTAEGEEIKML